jgi:hypothetical protein
MKNYDEILKSFYEVFGFPEDPRSKLGSQRYEKAIKKFQVIVEHEWFKNLIQKKEKIRILEICSGMGIGGVALAKVISGKNINVNLILTDLRDNALKVAKEWGYKELGKEIQIIKVDAKEIHTLKTKVDVILMYGLSAPHFSPWDMVRLLASASEILVDDGLMIMEEGDRIYRIFYQRGYKEVLPERVDEEKMVISAHVGYDMIKGVFNRAVMDLVSRSKPVILEAYFWGLAELMTFTWLFFEDIDFIKDPEGNTTQGFIIAIKPRRKIPPSALVKNPKILRDVREKEH